jgi:hypothetical protein
VVDDDDVVGEQHPGTDREAGAAGSSSDHVTARERSSKVSRWTLPSRSTAGPSWYRPEPRSQLVGAVLGSVAIIGVLGDRGQ